jgi:DNA-binding transcriptional ArsR family regulator
MENIRQTSLDLKCLANEHRLTIILFLKNRKSASVGEISDNTKISFKATSKHLLYLVKRGLLISHYDGPFVMYSLSANPPGLIKNLISFL